MIKFCSLLVLVCSILIGYFLQQSTGCRMIHPTCNSPKKHHLSGGRPWDGSMGINTPELAATKRGEGILHLQLSLILPHLAFQLMPHSGKNPKQQKNERMALKKKMCNCNSSISKISAWLRKWLLEEAELGENPVGHDLAGHPGQMVRMLKDMSEMFSDLCHWE